MPMSFNKKLTVKIELKDNSDELRETGSGIIVVHHGLYYVLTSYHCLNPKDENDEVTPRRDDWIIKLWTENGNEIGIKNIKECKLDDTAIIEIECPDIDIVENKVQLFTSVVKNEKYLFRGFPAYLNYEPHTFRVSYIDDDYWSFVDKAIDSGRKTGTELMEGVSGSGIVFCRREKYFVVGIVRALHDKYGTFNEFRIIPIEKYKRYLPEDAFSRFSADLVDDWRKSLDKDNTAKQIEQLKQKEITWLNNIVRKLKVMYPEQHEELLDYFLGCYIEGREFFVKEGKVNPTFWNELKEKTKKFFSTHQPTREIIVDSAGEAKGSYESLEKKLIAALEDLIPEDGSDKEIGTSFAKYKLTERLLVCTLDYINRNNKDGATEL